MPSSLPEPGQIVMVRQRPFVVCDILPSILPLPASMLHPMAELERSIHETLADKHNVQLQFDWTLDEKQQRERDLSGLRARHAQLPGELKREVEHLRNRYRDPKPRLFPVAVTFLVPHRSIAALHQGGGR